MSTIRSPAISSNLRIPSAAISAATDSTSITISESGDTTIGREKSACAASGKSTKALTSGQSTGPPAEKAYAVEPVGVAQMTPSQPHLESGRSSIWTKSSIIWVALRSIVTSLRAQPL